MTQQLGKVITYNGITLTVTVDGELIDLLSAWGVRPTLTALRAMGGLYFVGDGCEAVFNKLCRDRKVAK